MSAVADGHLGALGTLDEEGFKKVLAAAREHPGTVGLAIAEARRGESPGATAIVERPLRAGRPASPHDKAPDGTVPHDHAGPAHVLSGGHEMRATGRGVEVCSFPCDWFDRRYRKELDRVPGLEAEWNRVEAKLVAAASAKNTALEAAAWKEALEFQDKVHALHVNYTTTLDDARARFPGVAAELSTFQGKLAAQNGAEHAEVLNDLAQQAAAGKLTGFEDWVREKAPRRQAEQTFDDVAEALEARRVLQQYADDPNITVELVMPTPAGPTRADRTKSFDIHVIDKSGGTAVVKRRIEVERRRLAVADPGDFLGGISHGAKKTTTAVPIPGAALESTVQVGWPPPKVHNLEIHSDGTMVWSNSKNPAKETRADLAQKLLDEINTTKIPNVPSLARINVIDQKGDLIFSYVNDPVGGANWKLEYRR